MEHRRTQRLARAATALASLGLVTTLAVACELPGETYVVTTTADQADAVPGDGACETAAGACSLRAAIAEANAGPGLANVELGDGLTYELTTAGFGEDANAAGDLDIARTIAINGRSTIDGGGLDRVLDVRSGTLFLEGPTITGGDIGPLEPDAANRRGGGVRVAPDAQLVAKDIVVEGNHAWHGGGGIAGRGNVTLDHSVVRANTSDGGYLGFEGPFVPGDGAGVAMEAGRLTVTDSTVTGNTIAFGTDGAGIYGTGSAVVALVRSTVDHNQGGGNAVTAPTLTVTTSTVSGNATGAAVGGSSLSIMGSTIVQASGFAIRNGGSATVQGSILAATASPACSTPVTSLGYGIATDASCGLTGPGDHPSTDPFLGPLTGNGGPTATHLPFAGSVALDAIPAGTVARCDGSTPTDQRGVTRPVGSACDIGAVEGSASTTAAPLTLTVDDAGSARDLLPGDGLCATTGGGCTLAAAVDETNAWPPADTVTIAPGTNPVVGPTEGLLVVGDLVLHGNGATISGGHDVLLAVDGPALTVDRATFVGPAGIRTLHGTMTLTETTIERAYVLFDAGSELAVIRSTILGSVGGNGHAVIDRSTISATAGYALGSGGLGVAGSGIEVRSSTIVGSPVGTAPAVSESGVDIPFVVRRIGARRRRRTGLRRPHPAGVARPQRGVGHQLRLRGRRRPPGSEPARSRLEHQRRADRHAAAVRQQPRRGRHPRRDPRPLRRVGPDRPAGAPPTRRTGVRRRGHRRTRPGRGDRTDRARRRPCRRRRRRPVRATAPASPRPAGARCGPRWTRPTPGRSPTPSRWPPAWRPCCRWPAPARTSTVSATSTSPAR